MGDNYLDAIVQLSYIAEKVEELTFTIEICFYGLTTYIAVLFLVQIFFIKKGD